MICTLTNECHGNGSKMNIIFSFICMFCRSLFVLLYFSFGHCVVCSSSIYGFWLLHLWYRQTLLIFMYQRSQYISLEFLIILHYNNFYTPEFPLMKDFQVNKNRFSIKLKTKCRVELFSIYTWDVVSSTAHHERDLNSQL